MQRALSAIIRKSFRCLLHLIALLPTVILVHITSDFKRLIVAENEIVKTFSKRKEIHEVTGGWPV